MNAGQFTGNAQSGSCSRPPPTWRHAPTSAGRQAIERTVWPPPACRSIATPIRIIDGSVVAYSRASVRMSSAGMPVSCDAHSGVYCAHALGELVEADGVVADVVLVGAGPRR